MPQNRWTCALASIQPWLALSEFLAPPILTLPSLVCDDYAGYKAGFVSGITEAGCMAHARRKFFDLSVSSKSQIAGQACAFMSQLYDVERELKHLSADERLQIRQAKSKPSADAFKGWMLLQRQKITDGSATAKALDYSLKVSV